MLKCQSCGALDDKLFLITQKLLCEDCKSGRYRCRTCRRTFVDKKEVAIFSSLNARYFYCLDCLDEKPAGSYFNYEPFVEQEKMQRCTVTFEEID